MSKEIIITKGIVMTYKILSRAVASETGQKVIAETKNVVGKAVKPITSAGMEMIDDGKLHLHIKEYLNKKELLEEISYRTNEEEGIELSNDELKKLIKFFNKPSMAVFILFRYFLLLFAVRIRGLKYQRDLDETRGLLKYMLVELNYDEAMLNLRYEEIAIASRNIIPQVIDEIDLIISNLIKQREKEKLMKEVIIENEKRMKEQEKKEKDEQMKAKTIEMIKEEKRKNEAERIKKEEENKIREAERKQNGEKQESASVNMVIGLAITVVLITLIGLIAKL